MTHQPFFLGRQPILNRQGEQVAYELLFRSSHFNSADITDDVSATSSVIQYAFSELGIHHVLGKHRGFINISRDLLMSDLIELLPKEQVVLELLETIELDSEVIARCKYLKQEGFTLALDDVIQLDKRLPDILPFIDIVKLDLLGIAEDKLGTIVEFLRKQKVSLLAEKIDNAKQHQRCMELGFDLFQGYYFAKPTMLEGKKSSTSHIALLTLLGLVMRDAEVHEIEQVFKRNPNLAVNLMKIVNSVGSGANRQIDTLSRALIILGRQQLKRWIQVLMFSSGDTGNSLENNPLMLLASVRGKQMEILAGKLGLHSEQQDQAFMIGIFSLLDALFQQPLVEIITPLNLDPAVHNALILREGELGRLLLLVEETEKRLDMVTGELPVNLNEADLLSAELQALEWANQLNQSNLS